MRRPLSQIPPGTRFLHPDLQIIGTLVAVTDCAAKVELERPMQFVEFTDPDSGERRSFAASRSKTTTWAPSVSVLVISRPESEPIMTTATKTPKTKVSRGERELKKRQRAAAKSAKAEAKPPKAAETRRKPPKPAEPKAEAKPAAEPKEKKVSALDAAYRVLVSEQVPMGCQALIDLMESRRLWTSPGGKTPAATLYAAICREINTKGDEARFEKVDRGTFKAR